MNPTDKSSRRVLILGITIPVGLLILLIGSLLFNFSLTSQKTAKIMLENTLKGHVETLTQRLDEELSIMTKSGVVVRDVMQSHLPQTRTDTLPFIGSLCANSDAYQVVYCGTAGEGITNAGIYIDVGQDNLLRDAENTDQYYTYLQNEPLTQAQAIVSVIPVLENGKTCGYLLMYYSLNRILELFEETIPYEESSLIFSTDDGLVLLTHGLEDALSDPLPANSKLLQLLQQLDPIPADLEQVHEDLDRGINGSLTVLIADSPQELFFHPLQIRDWYLTVGIHQPLYQQMLRDNWGDMHRLITYLLAVLMLFLVVVSGTMLAIHLMYKSRNHHLEKRATTDFLSGVYNKMATEEEISGYLTAHPQARCILFILDVDNFKTINDTRGHEMGDQVIASIGRHLRNNFRSDDIVGRIGGDEFLIFLKDIPSDTDLHQQIRRVQKLFCQFTTQNELHIEISTSIGAAIFPTDATSFTELYKAADRALYQAKKHGKSQLFCNEGDS